MTPTNGFEVVTLKVRRYAAGYELRYETWDHGEGPMAMTAAYTPSGDYIGTPRNAYFLVVKKGIAPEKIAPDMNVCSIGYCKRRRQWFGWSHRAIFGFGIGARVKKGDCAAASLKVGFTAKTLADAKRMAIAFARSVS